MKFIPYYDKIVIKTAEVKGIIVTDGSRKIERGEVIAIGDSVKFFAIGDTVYFDSWGCSKTAPNEEGEEHYVLSVNERTIYGKEPRGE